MKQLPRLLLIIVLAFWTLGANGCDPPTCTFCGFEPNSQQYYTYTNTEGQTVNIVFWADSSGCVKIYECAGP